MWPVELYAGPCAASPRTAEPEDGEVELVPEQGHCMVTPCWQKLFRAQPPQRLRNILIKRPAGAEVAKQHHDPAAAIQGLTCWSYLPSLPRHRTFACSAGTGRFAGAVLKQELLLVYGQLSPVSLRLLEKPQAGEVLQRWGSS